jgi:ATP-dependent DNA helicase RecG
MAEKIGITSKGVEYNIDKLKKEGILNRIGPDKGGYWKI